MTNGRVLVVLVCILTAAKIAFGQSPGEQQKKSTNPLPTGVSLDPVGEVVELGSMPLGLLPAPGGGQVVAVLSGWREQGIQVIDLRSKQVTQTLKQEAAFYGAAFSRDGRELFVSGGNEDAVYCYAWSNGRATFDRRIVLGRQKEDQTGSRYPAGIAVSRNGKYLYVAENVGDSLAVVDLTTDMVVERFATDHYPYAVEVSANGKTYVSAWGGSTVSVFRERGDGTLIYERRFVVGRHPSALLANKTGSRLFAALGGTDQIAVIDTKKDKVLRYLSDSAPGGPAEGSTPNALALAPDESNLYVAEADNNAIAVFEVSEKKTERGRVIPDELKGRIPTDWYPTALLHTGAELLVLNGKGHGAGPNRDGPVPGQGIQRPLGYDLGQLNGTLRILPGSLTQAELARLSKRVGAANRWQTQQPRHFPPFKHVIYIIKENRTYDQVFGDLPEGDGDPSLVFFGQSVSPNHHALAVRFGLFERFFTNAEVSSQGHIWSTAAYVTDYGEKSIPSSYASKREGVDGEESNEPNDGFLWGLAAKRGVSFRDYGEMVKTPEGWPVTQQELGPDVSAAYPPFNLNIPDQARADAWTAEFERFVKDGNLPQLEIMHLPSDHTAGGRAGFPTPRAYMADNDLALGRIVETLSKSKYWRDTVMFVLEDDSQGGADHVDSHRSVLLVVSAYNRPGTIHRFVNTTDVVAGIEDILGLDRLSKYDYFSRPLADIFAETAKLDPYAALTPGVDLKETNPPETLAARMSEGLDFSAPDRVNDSRFNEILWLVLKGQEAAPARESKAPIHALQLSH